MRLAALGVSYERVGDMLGFAKSTLCKWLTHLKTGKSRYRATSLLERFDRAIRARERMGTVWTVHNLLVMPQLRGALT